jgi:hypothetical protein
MDDQYEYEEQRADNNHLQCIGAIVLREGGGCNLPVASPGSQRWPSYLNVACRSGNNLSGLLASGMPEVWGFGI